jgi:hypothetical protein
VLAKEKAKTKEKKGNLMFHKLINKAKKTRRKTVIQQYYPEI